ncbi:MAG TPA: hypothetical protein DIW44_06050 [Anaerolineaceae bacterium]|nr:hypothetical protein [Anaerolineaceae bacterium]
MEFRSRVELLNKIVCVFSEQPEVREITLFGSCADATEDNYSDIDIRVHSNDLLCTQSKYLQLINNISPIFETLNIQSDSENLAQMIMLRDYSPYHKIDFGISSGDCIFSPSQSIYKNEQTKFNDSKLQTLPATKDIKYDLDYLLFRVPRITKCFFRKDIKGYKKWRETVNLLLGLLFEKYHTYKKSSHKNVFSRRKISNLYRRLNTADKMAFDKILPQSGELNLVDSFLEALKLIIAISKDKAAHFNIFLNEDFITYIENFCDDECNKVNEEQHLRNYWTISLDKIDIMF